MHLLLAVPAVSGAYTYAEVKRLEAAFPPNGQFVTVGGHKVHYVERGIGRPIVLMHGANSTAQDFVFSPIFDELAKTHRVIAVDRPGYGYSERFIGAETPAAQARHLHAFLEQKNIEKPVLVGFSWSGALVASYAVQFPDSLTGLVVINGATHPWPLPDSWIDKAGNTPLLGELMAWTLTMPLGKAKIPGGVKRVFSPNPVPAWYGRIPMDMILRPGQFLANSTDMINLKSAAAAQKDSYANITTPTVILVGEEDRVASPKIHSEPLHEAVKGSRLIRVKGAGHPLHHTHPAVVVSAIESLLSE